MALDRYGLDASGSAGPLDARAITRKLILAHLRDTDDDEDINRDDLALDISTAAGDQIAHKDDSGLADFEPSLPEARGLLAALCEEEDSQTGWEPEYILDRHASVRGLRKGSRDDQVERRLDLTQGLEALKRIAKGQGPRVKEYEDLLAPLRRPVAEEDVQSNASSYIEETYEEMLQVLLAWNRSVAPIEELAEQRQELLSALEERNRLIDDARQLYDLSILDQPSPRLQRAIHAFRPETGTFENQNVNDILIVMVANLRVAKPDIDDDVKSAIFLVMIKEAMARMVLDTSYRQEKHRLHEERKAARISGYDKEADRLSEEGRQFDKLSRKHRVEEIIDNTKFARHDLHEKILREMQDLAVLQAAQLEAASELRSSPVIFKKIEEAMKSTSDDGVLEVGDRCECDMESIATMLELARGCFHRARKFAALDIKDPGERERVKKERMRNPGTAGMMLKVVDDTRTVRRTAGLVLSHMDKLETSLDTILEAANERYRTYQGGMQMIGELDPDTAGEELDEAGDNGSKGQGGEVEGHGGRGRLEEQEQD
ncbi:hypothetical protein CC80DRAFT_539882 [Byssothecium circinans]|uniref:Uncharacterized protein n=1 Tax=Byssothecium circinans TaxID=147558 RepID=A0A6A5TAR4_9PLEO|nr:hypothetical protein CC80DRAFT_539882 [Byssothecium circinans]